MSERTHQLVDGTKILTRPISAEDKDAIRAGFELLSPKSRYLRFFTSRDRLADRDLHYLTEVDHHDHEAIIGFEPGSSAPVGVARFVRLGDTPRAEVAVTVVDAWQHRGIASLLLTELVRRANDEGVEQFVAVMLGENRAAAELFRNLTTSDPEEWRNENRNLELLIELPDPDDELSDSLLGRTLRLAAREELELSPWRLLKRKLSPGRETDAG